MPPFAKCVTALIEFLVRDIFLFDILKDFTVQIFRTLAIPLLNFAVGITNTLSCVYYMSDDTISMNRNRLHLNSSVGENSFYCIIRKKLAHVGSFFYQNRTLLYH